MEDVRITRHDHGGGSRGAPNDTRSHGEYRAHVPGSTVIGRLTWVSRNGARVANQTLVPPEIGGRGIAAKLVEALIADAREQGFKIEPACSYVDAAFRKHPEWAQFHA
jgi:predicted GNAT family acetyltransferase